MISSSSYSTQSIQGGRLSWEFFMAIPRWWSKQWLIKYFADKSIAPHGHQFESPLYKFRLLTGTAFSSNLLICSNSNRLLRNLSQVGPKSPGPVYLPTDFPFQVNTCISPFSLLFSSFAPSSFALKFSIFFHALFAPVFPFSFLYSLAFSSLSSLSPPSPYEKYILSFSDGNLLWCVPTYDTNSIW